MGTALEPQTSLGIRYRKPLAATVAPMIGRVRKVGNKTRHVNRYLGLGQALTRNHQNFSPTSQNPGRKAVAGIINS